MTSPAPDNDTQQRGAALATALQDMFASLSTDPPWAKTAVVLTLTEPGGERHEVELHPGQAAWLTSVVRDETATCHSATVDGTARCAHCSGNGTTARL